MTLPVPRKEKESKGLQYFSLGSGRLPLIRNVMHIARAAGKEIVSTWTPDVAPTDRDAVQKELGKFQGAWMLVYWLYNGKERPAREEKIIFSFVGEKFTIRAGETLIEKGALEGLDPEHSPKTFVYAPTEVEGRPFHLKFPGIYLLEDDVFVACVGYGRKRPVAFSAEAESENELVFYKRVKRYDAQRLQGFPSVTSANTSAYSISNCGQLASSESPRGASVRAWVISSCRTLARSNQRRASSAWPSR
jgi:uncharacterized protein (TIGR03067 family)